MESERHHEILKRLSKFGSVRVSGLSNNLNATKETIRSNLDELARLGYLTRCRGGAFIVLDSLDAIVKNEIVYALENYDTTQGIEKSHSTVKSQVCVIGSFNVDIIGYLPRLPTIRESLLTNNFIFSSGGKGCNQALTANFADINIYFITKVGTNRSGDYAINFINSFKIYKSIIYQMEEAQTGTTTLLVNGGAGNNVIAIHPGANTTMSSNEITIQKEAIINSGVILLQLETNYTALQQTITLMQKNNIPVIIGPTPYNDIVNELIRDVDHITSNETEADLLSGIDIHDLGSVKRAAEAIHNKGIESTVITLGRKGSLASGGKKFIHSSMFPVVVKNTTRAGDASSGTLTSGLARGESLESTLCYASAFASLTVGTSNASDMPEHESVIHRIQSIHYQQTIFTH